MRRRSALPALTLLLAAACAPDDASGPPAELTALPRPLTAQEERVVDATSAFAVRLLRQAATEDAGRNVFLSPLSASMALGMAANGAAGTTRAEMLATLGFGAAPIEDANAAYASLLALLTGLDRSVSVQIANSIWYRADFPFSAAYLATGRQVFGATLEPVSFSDPATRTRINAWVRDATNGRITNMVESLDPTTVMMLLNAVHFKGAWRDAFDPASTRAGTFTPTTGAAQSAQLMSHTEPDFPARFTPTYSAVQLPYGGGAYVMTVLLPNPGRTTDELLASLTPADLAALDDPARVGRAGVVLPRFRLEYEKALNETLQALGMRAAFLDGQADFTTMSPTRGRELVITAVKQKTFVEVDEAGTEAAAATSVEIGLTSLPPVVVVDRPFVFAIRERLSGTVLFIGRLARMP